MVSTSNQRSYKNSDEWKRYKTLNTIGWSALAVGVPTTFIGTIGLALDNKLGGGIGQGNPFVIVVAVGGTLTLASIPILISANHYKKQAKKYDLKIRFTSLTSPSSMCHAYPDPAICFRLNF